MNGGASAEIEEIWVQPSARGQGIGGRLLRTAVAECRRRGIESIELRVTPDDQELGIPDFYTKQGFSHGGRLIYEFAGADSEVRTPQTEVSLASSSISMAASSCPRRRRNLP